MKGGANNMYIEELHMVAFGRFQDYKLSLHKELNIIYGDNEAGKSTVWYFICGMFYGFYRPNIKTRRYLPEHERYRPWTGNAYKGSMLLYDEHMKRHVRIYRDFMSGQESVEAYDEETGENLTALYDIHPIYRCPDIAKKHLGISYGSFMNTYGSPQLGQATDATLMEEVKQLLVAGMTGRKDAISLQDVKQDIQDKLQSIGTKRRRQSPLGKAYDQLEDINNRLDEAIGKQQQIRQAIRRLEDQLPKDAPIKGLTADDLYEGVSIYQEYGHVQEELYKLKERLEEEKEEYRSTDTGEQKTFIPLIDEMEKTLAKMRQDFAATDQLDDILEARYNKKEQQSILLLAISGFAVIAGIIGLFLQRPLIVGVMGVIALGCIAGAVLSHRTKKKTLDELNRTRMKDIEAKMLAKHMEQDIQRFKLKEEEASIKRENNMVSQLRMKSIIERDTKELEMLQRQEGELRAELEPYEAVVSIKNLQHIQQIASTQREFERLRQEWEVLARQEDALSIEGLKEERTKILGSIEALEYEYQVYQSIWEHMEEVALDLQKQMAPSLNEAMTRRIYQVTQGKYNRVFMTPDMEIVLDGPELTTPKSVEQLSRGTLDAIYISVRFALAKHLYGDRHRPYIMDESLVHMDDERFGKMMAWIIREEGQRLLFTCHKREQAFIVNQKENGEADICVKNINI